MTSPTWCDFAADLRALAADLASVKDLPLPRYPNQGLSIDIVTATADDVDQAARTFSVEAVHKDSGHTKAAVAVGMVTLTFIHCDDAAMATYEVRQAFAETMPAGWPASVLKPDYTPELTS
jgi:hypothetical protein